MIDRLKKGMAENGVSVRSVTAVVVFGAIALVFVFFGLPSHQGGGIGSVATVNGVVISVAEFQKEEERVAEYMSSLFGGNMDLGPQRGMLRQQAIESLIQAELINQVTKEEGILSPDSEVRDVIVKDISAFQKDGKFERDYYERYLQATRSSQVEFENRIRKEMKANRVRSLFETALRPNQLEEKKLADLRANQMNVAFVKMSDEQMNESIQVSESEVKAALAQADGLKKAEEYFNSHKSEFGRDEEVRAQHILILAKEGDAKAEAEALAKIKAIKEQLKKGDFAKIAEKESQDPGSKQKGGDLGFFSRGSMVKEFEDVAFGSPVGKVSEPVKTSYGYHLIKVTDKKSARVADFEKQKDEAMKKVISREKSDKLVADLDKAVAAKDLAQVDSLIKSLGARWEETGFFDLNSESIPKVTSAGVTQAIYELGPKKMWIDRVIREANEKYIVKLKEVKKSVAANEDLKAQRDRNFAQKRRGDSAFGLWLKDRRQESKVTINPVIFQN